MIEIFTCFANLRLDSVKFVKLLNCLRTEGKELVLLESKIKVLSIAGINLLDKGMIEWISRNRTDYNNPSDHSSDLFIENHDLYFIINHHIASIGKDTLEIGLITKDSKNGKTNLSKFSYQVTDAIKNSIDGRQHRHYDLGWYVTKPHYELQYRLNWNKKYFATSLAENKLKTAAILKYREVRDTLIKISRSKYAKLEKTDSLSENKIISCLLANGLIERGLQVSCKNGSRPYDFVITDDDYNFPSENKSICKKCSNVYTNENLQKGFALTALATELIETSNWMTILLTQSLYTNGIPLTNIIINLSEDSEEIDCIVDFKGKNWIFELKDSSFDAGHAHPFIYRAIKYKAKKIVIVTTEKVSPDARKIFKEILSSYSAAIDFDEVVYIEGIENLDDRITEILRKERIDLINKKIKELGILTSINLRPIYKKLFNEVSV